MQRCLRTTEGGVSVISHRGAPRPGAWRENTIRAFEHARELGADGVELDVRLTRDGSLVVHHDAELSAEDGGAVIGAVRRDDLPDWLPDLQSVLRACVGMLVDVELKLEPPTPGARLDTGECRAMASGVAESLAGAHRSGARVGARNEARNGASDDAANRAAGAAPKVVVSSFRPDALVAFGEVAPGVPLGLLVHPADDARRAVQHASGLGCACLLPHQSAADRDLLGLCAEAGLEVGVWTVNDAVRVRSLVSDGAEAIITDDTAMALSALGRKALQGDRPGGSADGRWIEHRTVPDWSEGRNV